MFNSYLYSNLLCLGLIGSMGCLKSNPLNDLNLKDKSYANARMCNIYELLNIYLQNIGIYKQETGNTLIPLILIKKVCCKFPYLGI